MVKGQKSSASSGTRKKNARKAGPQEPSIPKEKKAKGKEKGNNKEPRKKIYVPPVKPAPVLPDPLDTLGLAHELPPELLVVLRSLRKKDVVTKTKALEELQMGWIDNALKEGDTGPILPVVVLMLPVWVHHLPALFLHPSRRVRVLATGVHSSLLHLNGIWDALLTFLREAASSDQVEFVLGTWCMAAHDADRLVATYARRSWNEFVSLTPCPRKLILDESLMSPLLALIQRTALDPSAVYLYLNPPQAQAAPHIARKGFGKQAQLSQVKKKDEDVIARVKSDEEEENEEDRKARLRIGALGAVKWVLDARHKSEGNKSILDLVDLLGNPAFWTSLHHAQTSPWVDIESFGYNQPGVRKSTWSLLQVLTAHWAGYVETILPILGPSILRSAWVEPDPMVRAVMWQSLLIFLKGFPQAWTIEDSSVPEQGADGESDAGQGSDGESDSGHAVDNGSHLPVPENRKPDAYREFLQFLELGCSGSPLQGYPTVVIILSTIPSPIFVSPSLSSSLSELFSSFWAAIDGRALSSLDRSSSSAAFLSSLLECTIFLVRRIRNDPSLKTGIHQSLTDQLASRPQPELSDLAEADEMSKKMVGEQFGRVVEELMTGRLRIEEAASGKLLAQSLSLLEQIGEDFFSAGWDPIASAIASPNILSDSRAVQFASAILKIFDRELADSTIAKAATRSSIRQLTRQSLAECQTVVSGDEENFQSAQNSFSLERVIEDFNQILFSDAELAPLIDRCITQNAPRLVTMSPSLLLVYLSCRRDDDFYLETWHQILYTLAGKDVVNFETSLSPFVKAAQNGRLPESLSPKGDELDTSVGHLLAKVLGGSTPSSGMRGLLQTPKYFISENSLAALVQSLTSAFALQFEHALRDASVSIHTFRTSLDLLEAVFESHPQMSLSPSLALSFFPDVFLFAYLLPKFCEFVDDQSSSQARSLWTSWLARRPTNLGSDVAAVIVNKLRDIIVDIQVLPTPENILQMISEGCPGLHIAFMDIIPPRQILESMLEVLPSSPINSSVAVVNDLIPPASFFKNESQITDQLYDSAGYSQYGRITKTLLYIMILDRQLAKENIWALWHLLSMAVCAEDSIQMPSGRSPLFAPDTSKGDLQAILSKVQQVTTYLLVPLEEAGWHLNVVNSVREGQTKSSLDGPSTFLADLLNHANGRDTVRESRVLYKALQHVLRSASREDGDHWILLSRQMEKSAPLASMAIISAVAAFGPEPPRLDRYRNEMAANMVGLPASKANKDGLLTLLRLAAAAPDPDSDVIFLSQPRAINLMKACQQWVASDEDISEDVESSMTLIFFHLVPILQDVAGDHWDFIFDISENNLENCSFNEDSTLVSLARTLRLVIAVQDLGTTNNALRAIWDERRVGIITLIRDLVSARENTLGPSVPRSVCLELALSMIQDMPTSLIDHNTLPAMCNLLNNSSLDAQKMAYQLLHEAARKHTDHLVIEAGLDTEDNVKCELPTELMDILGRTINVEDQGMTDENFFGYFLGWMVVFDLFTNASFKVKSGYIQHIRSLDIIGNNFIPFVFDALGLFGGLRTAFKLDIWSVEEYHIDSYDSDDPFASPLQAAHLYYRSLLTIPSVIRSWLQDCKDRTLCSTVVTYTSQHFSPVIIDTELAQVRSPEAQTELDHENFTVKVASAVDEITASFAVDEHQLEISLKLPSDWPLHMIEVRDSKKVGVEEKRWRAWVLGVQQIMWSQNGSIVDGLSLFKRNVSLHFEGQVECAICYSIISPMDHSLPKKPCKTCKNRFHAICLYKWFDSSHSSTCPLCRSNIF